MSYIVNLNDRVRVKLNDRGRMILYQHYQGFGIPSDARPDSEGYVTMQLWVVMQIFGPTLQIGFDTPFTPNDIILLDQPA